MQAVRKEADRRLRVDLWEMVVWAYRKQKVIEATGKYLYEGEAAAGGVDEWHGESACGCAALARKQAIGVTISGTLNLRGVAADVHPDAERLHDIVLGMGAINAFLIAKSGQAGEPPEWEAALPRPMSVPGPTGEHKVIRDYEAVRGRQIKVQWCPVVYWPTLELADAARASYLAWYDAMWLLMLQINAAQDPFRRYLVTGFDAEAEPWFNKNIDKK